jgi:hypothetical protein
MTSDGVRNTPAISYLVCLAGAAQTSAIDFSYCFHCWLRTCAASAAIDALERSYMRSIRSSLQRLACSKVARIWQDDRTSEADAPVEAACRARPKQSPMDNYHFGLPYEAGSRAH